MVSKKGGRKGKPPRRAHVGRSKDSYQATAERKRKAKQRDQERDDRDER